MSKEELDNLVRINRLKAEPASRVEFAGMMKSARTRLVDHARVLSMLKMRVSIPTADLIWRTALPIGWQ